MAKNNISDKDLQKWVEANLYGTVDEKPIDKKTAENLDRIGARQVTLAEATTVARAFNQALLEDSANNFDTVFNGLDLVMLILDELGVTEEQISKAKDTLQQKREDYFKEKQEELRKHQEEHHHGKKEAESDSNEKVVQLKKHDKQ